MKYLLLIFLCLCLVLAGSIGGASFAVNEMCHTTDGTFESYMQSTSIIRVPAGFEVWMYAGSKDASKCGGPFVTLEQVQIFRAIECCDMVKIHEEIK